MYQYNMLVIPTTLVFSYPYFTFHFKTDKLKREMYCSIQTEISCSIQKHKLEKENQELIGPRGTGNTIYIGVCALFGNNVVY